MQPSSRASAALGIAVLLGSSATEAHFRLESPPAAFEQDAGGDYQKSAPCGPSQAQELPTGIVTTFQAGSTISITIDETIYHPGHYRVALAVNDPSELPDAPPVTPVGNDPCGSTVIQDPPVFPVLADGLIAHDAPFSGPQTFEVTLPTDVTCDNCTLQVLQYMSSHGAPCFYYHCATIAIQEEPVMTTAASTSAGPGGTTAGSGGDMNGAGGAGGDPGNPSDGEADEGCSCGTVGHTGDALGSLGLLLGLAALASRRRSSARGRP